MTTLLTLLAIALVGILYMIGIKILELRSGRTLFLPQWLSRHNDSLRIRWFRLFHAVKRRCTLFLYQLLRSLYHGALHGLQRAQTLREWRGTRTLEKNENASSFIREMNNHKQEFRKENGYHEE